MNDIIKTGSTDVANAANLSERKKTRIFAMAMIGCCVIKVALLVAIATSVI